MQQSVDSLNDPSIYQSNLDFSLHFERVWKHVPQLTPGSRAKLVTLTKDYTTPDSDPLVQSAANIIFRQVDSLITTLVNEKKLRPA